MKDGLNSWCRGCSKEYRLANKEKIRLLRIAWYEENPKYYLNYNKEYYQINKEDILNHKADYYKNNPDKLDDRLAWSKNWNKEHPVVMKAAHLKSAHGLSFDQYQTMLFEQDYCCAICGINESDLKEMSNRGLCVDHDHKTGLIRKLLCDDCNTGLGRFRDDISSMKNAINYLKEHS